MALEDLYESMSRLADFMDGTFLKGEDGSDRIRGLRDQLKEASSAGKTDLVKEILLEVSINFDGWMLNDILFGNGNNNVPKDMTADQANSTFGELLDDLFFNLLFWETKREKALKKYASIKRRYDLVWDKKDAEFVKAHPERPQGTPGRIAVPMRVHYNFEHEFFKEGTDLGKLLVEKEKKVEAERKEILRLISS